MWELCNSFTGLNLSFGIDEVCWGGADLGDLVFRGWGTPVHPRGCTFLQICWNQSLSVPKKGNLIYQPSQKRLLLDSTSNLLSKIEKHMPRKTKRRNTNLRSSSKSNYLNLKAWSDATLKAAYPRGWVVILLERALLHPEHFFTRLVCLYLIIFRFQRVVLSKLCPRNEALQRNFV